jgi:hypothetical protein
MQAGPQSTPTGKPGQDVEFILILILILIVIPILVLLRPVFLLLAALRSEALEGPELIYPQNKPPKRTDLPPAKTW